MSKKPAKPAKLQPSSIDQNIKQSTSSPASKFKVDSYWIFFGLSVALVSFIRLRLVPMPLERDEGEYAYMGKLILDGILPYKEAYNMKLPGTYFMYAFIELIFGKTFSGIHTGLWIMNISTMLFLFLGFKKIYNPLVGSLAAAGFGLMSVSMNVLGFAAHATHFVTFYAAMGIWALANLQENKKTLWAFLSGVCFGMSFLMKQQAVFFIVFGGIIVLVIVYIQSKDILQTLLKSAAYSFGAFLPYILVVLLMLGAGNFDKFWFWTFQYASKYAAGVSWDEGKTLLGMTFQPMWDEYMLMYMLSFAGLVMIWISNYSIVAKTIGTTFFCFAFLTVCPGFYFRQHYFIPWIPAVTLLAAVTIDVALAKITSKKLSFIGFTVFSLVVIIALAKNKVYYFKTKPEKLCKMIYGLNPFPESVEIASYIKSHTAEEDKIAVLGSEPQIAFYADRKSATGHIYTYGLMEIHDYNKKMQQEMIAEIENGKPKYLVYCNVRFSWLPRPGSVMDIFDWYQKYAAANYELVGIGDMVSPMQTNFYWNEQARMQQPQGQEYVLVYKRKS